MQKRQWLASVVMVVAAFGGASVMAQGASSKPAQSVAPAAKAEAKGDYAVLLVNGKKIMRSQVQELWQSMFEGRQAPDFDTQPKASKQNILNGLASETLVFDKAVEAGIDKEPAILRKLEIIKRQMVLQEWVSRQTRDALDEEALKAYYDKKLANTDAQVEVRTRHILLNTQEDAKKAYERLEHGDEFTKVAKEMSVEKSSGAAGGVVGWVSKGVAVPDFVNAALDLKIGQYSKPVKSPFGYHIILAEERRTKPQPPFAEVHDKIAQEVVGKATRDMVQGLLKKADIQYFGADGERLPFDRTLPDDVPAAR